MPCLRHQDDPSKGIPAYEPPSGRIIVPRSQVDQRGGVPPLTCEAQRRRCSARASEDHAKRLIAPAQRYGAGRIGQLPDAGQSIPQVILPAAGLLLPDPAHPVEEQARAVAEHLGQAGTQIQRAGRWRAVDDLPKPVAQPVVDELVGVGSDIDLGQPVGVVVAVAAQAVVEQVATCPKQRSGWGLSSQV